MKKGLNKVQGQIWTFLIDAIHYQWDANSNYLLTSYAYHAVYKDVSFWSFYFTIILSITFYINFFLNPGCVSCHSSVAS